MAEQQIRVLTKDGGASGFTSVQGTKVFIGDIEVARITGLELVADIGGVWGIKLTIPVDPAKLFGRLSDEASEEVIGTITTAAKSLRFGKGR